MRTTAEIRAALIETSRHLADLASLLTPSSPVTQLIVVSNEVDDVATTLEALNTELTDIGLARIARDAQW